MNTFQKEMLKKGKSISLTLLSLLVFIACEKEAKPGMGGGPGKGKDMPPSVVDYTIATGQELTRTILATGNLLANETVEIRPERAGRLEKIYFKEGGQVVKGALLAELDRDDLEAQLAKLKVNEQFAERELKRAKSLLDIEGITQEEYDRLSTNLNLVKADIRVTEVGIEKTKIFERVIMVISGVALAYPSTEADLVGFIGFGLVLVTQTITHFKLNPRSS